MSLALVAAPSVAFEPRDMGAQCNHCPLGGEKRKPVPPQLARNNKPKLIIVGMNPGRFEVIKQIPFCGPSGKLLDDVLREKGFDRRDAHITNVAMCYGESDEAVKAASACCAPRLGNELKGFSESIPILSLGAIAVKPILGRGAIFKVRGFVWRVPEVTDQQLKAATKVLDRRLNPLGNKKRNSDQIQKARHSLWFLQSRRALQGRVVIPSVHPAFLLRGADAWRPVFTVDVEKAVCWSNGPSPLEDEGPYVESCDPKVVRRTLNKMRTHVAVDIETSGVDPLQATITCVGVSDDHDGLGTTLVISPWKSSLGPLLNAALKRRTAITHNGPSFDELALNRRRIRLPQHEDTLIGHHAFASHLRQGLDHVASVYCLSGPWKAVFKAKGAEEKGGLAKYSTASEDLARYNAADVRLDIRCWYRMQVDLDTERRVYEFDMRVAKELCQEMQRNGLLVDQGRRADLAKKLKFRAAALLGEMRSLLRRPNFNPGSLVDLRRALFTQCKAPQWLGPATKTGLPSTGKLVLEAMRGSETRYGKLADLITRRRSAKDIRSEYLVNIPIGKDGRVHPMWKSFGTISGRFATARPNVLNMPRVSSDPEEYETQIRDIYIAPRGKVYIHFDLCFAGDTLVDGPTGSKRIDRMRVGDLVYTYRKSTRKPAIGKVNQVHHVGFKPVIKVTLDNGFSIRCTPDHKWFVCPQRQMDAPVERRADQLKYGDRLFPLRKMINRGSWRHPSPPREYLYAHSAIESSQTHVEVARTVYGPRPDGHHVHHIDENAMNNDPENLEYLSAFEHISKHSREHALKQWQVPKIRKKMLRGFYKAVAEGRTVHHGADNGRYNPDQICKRCGAHKLGMAYIFCSQRCYGLSKIKPRTPCLVCAKPPKRPNGRFCSRKCLRVGLEQGLNHRVISVEPDGYADVWSIGVDPDHNYALAAGVFVKNCQAEPKFAAYISGDLNFIETCAGDVHTNNACILFPRFADVIRAEPKGKGKQMRQIAKSCGLAVTYLAEAPTVYATLHAAGFDVSLPEVEALLRTLNTRYRTYFKYTEANVALCRKQGFIRSPFLGRIIWMGFYPKPSSIANWPCQSGVADVMNLRLLEMQSRLPRNVKLVFCGYDSAVYEAPEAEVKLVVKLLTEQWSVPIAIPGTERTFVQAIELKTGSRLSEL